MKNGTFLMLMIFALIGEGYVLATYPQWIVDAVALATLGMIALPILIFCILLIIGR